MSTQGRNDLILALSGQTPQESVPLWELEFHIWNRFHQDRVIVGSEFAAMTPGMQRKTLEKNTQVMLEVSDQLQFSAITVPGAYWEEAPGHPAYYWLPEPARYAQIRQLAKEKPADLMLVAGSGGVLSSPAADEYMDFASKLLENPDEIDRRARACLNQGVETAGRLMDSGAEAIFTASDLADNHGMFFNPGQMKRFVLPFLREWAAEVKAIGAFAILHSDGNLMACLEDIANSGIHALQALDPVAGMDMRTVKSQVKGRLCLCGNVDCGLLLTGTPDDVYLAAKSLLIENKPDGGLILGASNALQPETPGENYLALVAARKDHGRYR